MTWGAHATIDRTAKILIDSGRAASYQQAQDLLGRLVLQIVVGAGIAEDPAAQAALATAVNAGRRAFAGGVHVQLECDPRLDTGWTQNATASKVIDRYGGTVVDRLDPAAPTLAIAAPAASDGNLLLHLTWHGWTGAAVRSPQDGLEGPAEAIAGVLAAALGVSEMFQHCLGAVVAGRRNVGVSLWRPDLPWRCAPTGPPLQFLPKALWLLGLGHLGQAYAWTLGMLPYSAPSEVSIGLMDFDVVEAANTATQLLVTASDVEALKTRVVADALHHRGLSTRLVERAFDENFRPVVHADPRRHEPTIALAGFDSAAPRRLLGEANFSRVVDAGLGAGPVEYLDMLVHTFPAARAPAKVFTEHDPPPLAALPDAYEAQIALEVADGADEAAVRCGLIDIAGITVGAAFVGAVASTFVIADVLRELHQGKTYSVIGCNLRDVDVHAVANNAPRDPRTIPYSAVHQTA
jgi:hypothetical protein